MFTTEHSVNINTPLPLQILYEDGNPINFVEDVIEVSILAKDDKSITISPVGQECNILINVSQILVNESSSRGYKYIKPDLDNDTIQVRIIQEIFDKCQIGNILCINTFYVGMVEKSDKSSGILFGVIPNADFGKPSRLYQSNVSIQTQTPDTRSKIQEMLNKQDDTSPHTKPRKLEFGETNSDMTYQEVDPKLLELIEQLIQAINRIADALERIEEKLDKTN
eukprot:TRINITY_DN7377_c0_g1_i1.p1 TRINITY_DN7377_c0_g1~~TRINITY_DN7377_c0_g1_i1.p1  ORF type:complete len:223 (-),score=27.73 TRINITY_DN7377_c0_g1_i1:4-672(-)